MSTWLITGGAGFIGSNLVRLLGKKPPARLLIFDALTYAGNLASIADLIDNDAICFVHGDRSFPRRADRSATACRKPRHRSRAAVSRFMVPLTLVSQRLLEAQ